MCQQIPCPVLHQAATQTQNSYSCQSNPQILKCAGKSADAHIAADRLVCISLTVLGDINVFSHTGIILSSFSVNIVCSPVSPSYFVNFHEGTTPCDLLNGLFFLLDITGLTLLHHTSKHVFVVYLFLLLLLLLRCQRRRGWLGFGCDSIRRFCDECDGRWYRWGAGHRDRRWCLRSGWLRLLGGS